MLGTRPGPAADAAWSTPAIIAETVSVGPELLLIAAVFLLVCAIGMVAYLVGGYVAVHRVAAGSRSLRDLIVAALAAVVGGYLVAVTVVDEEWSPILVLPAIHVVAAWRGWNAGTRDGAEGPPPPPPARAVD